MPRWLVWPWGVNIERLCSLYVVSGCGCEQIWEEDCVCKPEWESGGLEVCSFPGLLCCTARVVLHGKGYLQLNAETMEVYGENPRNAISLGHIGMNRCPSSGCCWTCFEKQFELWTFMFCCFVLIRHSSGVESAIFWWNSLLPIDILGIEVWTSPTSMVKRNPTKHRSQGEMSSLEV